MITPVDKSDQAPDTQPKNDGKAMQLAISLFSELEQHGATAESLPASVGFHKNNLFINIVDLSLAARRAIDVLYFITAQDPEYKSTYRIELDVFKWLMGYSSNNRKHLQSVLREGQKAAVQIEAPSSSGKNDDPWASIPMLGPVGIAGGKVYFEINHRLQAEIKSPAASHFLSLRYIFKSIHAKVLFDRLQLHISKGMTSWIPLEELRTWWGFASDEYAEFKKMRQRVIEKAVSQINEVTGLNVSYDTKNVPGSKRVGSIRFHIKKTDDFDAPQASMIALKAQYEVLRNEFGLNGAQLDEIVSNRDKWDDKRIDNAIAYTRHQLQQGKVKRNVAGYLMKAIRDEYTLGTAQIFLEKKGSTDTQLPVPDLSPLAQSLAEQDKHREEEAARLTALAKVGFEAYLGMPANLQADMFDQFARSLPAKTLSLQLRIEPLAMVGLLDSNPDVRMQFGNFVASRLATPARRRRLIP
ncbi:replication initiation protein [Achromobacter sp. DH1f]|uniref:replication initiation protein n=1 Tax=Achromobacter sp. DH1f TaxID=1397275 RepID=UPI000469AEDF|nr:replication initiation protein [Achromobacter sp. DH1f]